MAESPCAPRDHPPVGAELQLPALLPAKARALGPAGESWLSRLPGLVRDLEVRWELSDVSPLAGGSEAFVASAVRADGSLVVLKVGLPVDGFDAEVDTLVRARGTSYVEVLAHDRQRGAVLLERLGSPLASSGLSPQDQVVTLGRLLLRAWTVPPPRDGGHAVDKASHLAAYIETA